MKNYLTRFQNDIFAFESKNNILAENHIGISSSVSAVMTPERSVFALEKLQGCPYTNTSFTYDIRICGEKIKCLGWWWLPSAIYRAGEYNGASVETLTAVVPNMRTVVQKVTITNDSQSPLRLPLQVMYRGKTRREESWEFDIPTPMQDYPHEYAEENGYIIARNDDCGYIITSSLSNLKMFQRAYLWEGFVDIAAQGSTSIFFSVHMGNIEKCIEEAIFTKERYDSLIEASLEWVKNEEDRIFNNLPVFSSSDKDLEALYYRSLVTYILCRWENPDLCSVPYFSTGGINGGCMCSYLWNYCGGLMLHPLYDNIGNREQILALLKIDLTKSFALNPVTRGPVGPWYQVNQEKIIQMVYYHVLFTGDKAFLNEYAGDKTVIEWMKFHAYVCDDISKDVELYDYGIGGRSHLELREYNGIKPYDGIIPELNARRYMNYIRVYELTRLVGTPDEQLLLRANKLKEKLKYLWNEELGWYDYISASGERDTRYTVQMFKFLDSPVITDKERTALISHLNNDEFLSAYGLHSMSKKDPEYSQEDIDNGGGGICNFFTMRICGKLYDLGYEELATDILKRVYWWGKRMPYMGDSCAANMIMNREDTPLQGDIASIGCAQMIVYNLFGIKVDFDANISVSPIKNRPADYMRLDNIHLAGKVFSIIVDGDAFKVLINGNEYSSDIGKAIII